ncbi:hypothetical protein ACTD5D_22680 [Nocardia takedensis]|uniref:hypothetical protein n=1 Tax=Nocardia takedensis TaxID=259390 RepID=UPI003F764F70
MIPGQSQLAPFLPHLEVQQCSGRLRAGEHPLSEGEFGVRQAREAEATGEDDGEHRDLGAAVMGEQSPLEPHRVGRAMREIGHQLRLDGARQRPRIGFGIDAAFEQDQR